MKIKETKGLRDLAAATAGDSSIGGVDRVGDVTSCTSEEVVTSSSRSGMIGKSHSSSSSLQAMEGSSSTLLGGDSTANGATAAAVTGTVSAVGVKRLSRIFDSSHHTGLKDMTAAATEAPTEQQQQQQQQLWELS